MLISINPHIKNESTSLHMSLDIKSMSIIIDQYSRSYSCFILASTGTASYSSIIISLQYYESKYVETRYHNDI